MGEWWEEECINLKAGLCQTLKHEQNSEIWVGLAKDKLHLETFFHFHGDTKISIFLSDVST